MRSLFRFVRSEGWMAEVLATSALTVGLIAGLYPEKGITGRIFGYLIHQLEKMGVNSHENEALLWPALLSNLIVFASVFYIYRREIDRLAQLIATALQRFPEHSRYHIVHSLMVTSGLAAMFSVIATAGGTLGTWMSSAAVALFGNENFYLLRVPVYLCLAYPFCRCAIAAYRVANAFGNPHQDYSRQITKKSSVFDRDQTSAKICAILLIAYLLTL